MKDRRVQEHVGIQARFGYSVMHYAIFHVSAEISQFVQETIRVALGLYESDTHPTS